MMGSKGEDEGHIHSVLSGKRSCWSPQIGLDKLKGVQVVVGQNSGVHAKLSRGRRTQPCRAIPWRPLLPHLELAPYAESYGLEKCCSGD